MFPLNRLESVKGNGKDISYVYDHDNRRITKTEQGGIVATKYTYDDGRLSYQTGEDTITYVNGINTISHDSTLDGLRYYYHYNPHGDVEYMSHQYANIDAAYGYTEFGEQTNTYTSSELRYCAEQYDHETGYIYLWNRYYDPRIGRFISEDTHWNPSNMIYGDGGGEDKVSETIKRQQAIQKHIDEIYLSQGMTGNEKIMEATRWRLGQLTEEEKQSLEYGVKGIIIPSAEAIMQSGNLYAYGMNNPLKYLDSSGEFAVTATLATASAIAALKAVGIITSIVAAIAAVDKLVKYVNENKPVFYALDGHAFRKMRQISALDALVVLSGKNVYIPSQTAASILARVASLGLNPVHDGLNYNAHYHLHGRRNSAHTFYGFVK